MDEEQVRKMLAMSSCFAMDRTNGIANVCSTTPCACAASFVRLTERAVAAERERCMKIMDDCRAEMRNRILLGSCDVYEVLDKAAAAIRRGE